MAELSGGSSIKDHNWVRHTLAQKAPTEVGGTAFDVDGDIDICSKLWNGNEHVYLRNMLKESGGN